MTIEPMHMTTKKLMKSVILLLTSFVLATSGLAADDATAITSATTAYVKKETAINDPLVTVEKVVDGYARVQVKSKTGATDPAVVFLKLVKGNWKVLTLGTGFDPSELKKLKIPASLQP